MPTKIILHGGYPSDQNSDNDKFFKEILKDLPIQLRILIVCFARDLETDHQRMFGKAKANFLKNADNHQLDFVMADQKNFVEQLKIADVVYLYGGDTSMLLNKLKKFPDFNKLLKNKVVAGESAGAYVLSSYFYSKTAGGMFAGLGLVPVKIICHYVGENSEKLKEAPGNLEEVLLPAYKHKVFYVD